MLPQEIIRRKRDGHPLSEAEIGFFVRGIADGSIADGQVAAFAMAVFHRGMSEEETVALTRHMTGSGRRLHWHDLDLPGPVLDKHSTGGVGDKVSLMLAPILAAAFARPCSKSSARPPRWRSSPASARVTSWRRGSRP